MRVTSFYKWYIDWYKTILHEMTIMISLPNELQPFKEDNVVILELFKPTSDFVVSEPYLKAILEKADEFGIIIYLDPEPRYPTKNTKQAYIFWYKEFGFELTPNQQFMKRIPKTINTTNYEVAI
jgi:hypothetical protein